MSYGKKDEDADLGLVKVDRTQVFQEGESRRRTGCLRCLHVYGSRHRPSTMGRRGRADKR
jgi:hypothetical protein